MLNNEEEDFFNYILRVFYIHTKDSDTSFNGEMNRVFNELGKDSFEKIINELDNSGYLFRKITVKFPIHEKFETSTDGILTEEGINYVENELGLKL